NPCAAPVTIVSASSPSFGSVELHETTRVDGVSRMRHVDRLEVPAGGTATLAPGGLHLMLMQPRSTPALGESLQIELELADGRRLRAGLEVRAANALQPARRQAGRRRTNDDVSSSKQSASAMRRAWIAMHGRFLRRRPMRVCGSGSSALHR